MPEGDDDDDAGVGDVDDQVTSHPEQSPAEYDEAVMLEAFDLDHDGKVSIIEDARVRLGIIDANLEEHAKEPGVKGAIADVAHRALDKLDND